MAVSDEGETVELGRRLFRRTFEHALWHERVLQRLRSEFLIKVGGVRRALHVGTKLRLELASEQLLPINGREPLVRTQLGPVAFARAEPLLRVLLEQAWLGSGLGLGLGS